MPPHLERFAALVSQTPESIPLAEATLEIARGEYPGLDVRGYLERMDGLVRDAVRADPGRHAPADVRLQALNQVLFQDAGFSGNLGDGADPRNSYLNDALDRRTGLPVILSVIYLEVGARLGLRLAGVGMPLHFIVRLLEEEPPLFIDPFNKGTLMSQEDCRALLHRVSAGKVELQPEHLHPCSGRRILARILRNLKAIYVKDRDMARARRVVDQILIVQPEAVAEIRDRGMMAYQSLLFEQAVADLELYLDLAPEARDARTIRAQVQSLRRLVPAFN